MRVFHQGPGTQPNMTGCSFAVLHLLTQPKRRNLNQMMRKEP